MALTICDGSATFEKPRAGHPRQACYDLVCRHALAMDSAGIGLPTGSTTGGVRDDDDAGEHWPALPARLPPIHAVWMS
jgi:hypothetical protein